MGSQSALPVLYSFRRCPYAIRARLAVRSSGTAVALREIVLRQKPPEFLEASPSATVPTLVCSGAPVIDESLDIMLWALGRNGDPEHWLEPEKGTHEAGLALVAANDGPFKTHLDRYKYHVRHADCDPLEERALASVHLRAWDTHLSDSPWLLGSRASLADMAILPFVRQFANVDRDWFDHQDWPGLLRWLVTFENSERFAAVMHKYPPWTSDDAITVFGAETLEG